MGNAGLAPVDAKGHEADLAHHGVPRLIPELARHVTVVSPRLVPGLVDDAGHHFRNVDFPKTLEEHHEGLGPGWIVRAVDKGLGINALVPEVLKALVAFGHRVVDVRLDRVVARDCLLMDR